MKLPYIDRKKNVCQEIRDVKFVGYCYLGRDVKFRRPIVCLALITKEHINHTVNPLTLSLLGVK